MHIEHQPQALHIIGIELRTSNAKAGQTIPPHWQRFFAEQCLARITDRLSDDLYALYTHFEQAGQDNAGTYSLIIGAAVPAASETAPPAGMVRASIPVSTRAVFPVPGGRPENVMQAWQEVWSRQDLRKTYLADYEHYAGDGSAQVSIGIAPQP